MINKQNSPLFAQGLAKWDAFCKQYTGPYDFSKSVYAGMNQKVSYVCPVHGVMASDAKNLMQGKQCPKCAFAARKGRLRMTHNKMLARFKVTHGDKYDYSQAVYKGQRVEVAILCDSHGVFWQKPEYHWAGAGCPTCFHTERRGASQRDTYESFTAKVVGVFGDLFSIPAFQYQNSQQDIVVHCTKHKLDCQTRPNWLINGYNPCPKCNHMKSSGEEEVARYLSIFTPTQRRDRTILAPKELDIVLPEHQLAVEYCGMYWHSHGTVDEERRNKHNHYQKYNGCAAKGIRLLTIYETEWEQRKPAIKRLLRNAIGKSKGKVMARKCELRTVTNAEARVFYDKYHPQGGEGSGDHYALFWKGKMVACMRFVHGANDRGSAAQHRVWTLGRYATRITVTGGASKLFKAFLADKNPPEVKSFSDNRYFAGSMYAQLGFELEEDVVPDYQVWSQKLGLLPKSHYQRRNIPRKLKEHGVTDVEFDPDKDTRTEREMTFLVGARRIYDCGKKRWVYKSLARQDV